MSYKNEILAVVKFNHGEALVLRDPIEMKYERHGSTIIGTDGVFYNCFALGSSAWKKAFGGRKFTLTMKDGEEVVCEGQWWDSITSTAEKIIGNVVSVVAGSIDDLKRCYVFSGYYADKERWLEFRKTYTGPVYEYREYQEKINSK